MKSVIVIVGPTAIGKTQLSIKIADLLPIEVVSADSRQIYRLLDIGTAKPSPEILQKVPHHLINFLRPDEYFSAGMYSQVARKFINQIFKRKHVPVVVGGSGLYIKALIDGLSNVEVRDDKIRSSLRHRLLNEGVAKLFNELKQIDPVLTQRVQKNDKQRIIRGLEVYLKTGKRLSELQEAQSKPADFQPIMIGLTAERELLYARINERVEEMLQQGFLAEAANLKLQGFGTHLNALNSVGYKEIFEYLENQRSYDDMIDLIKQNTRKYAKRQMTWFRKDAQINWYKIEEHTDFEALADDIIAKYRQSQKNENK
jgi:tRNA dimethylallyltransferase